MDQANSVLPTDEHILAIDRNPLIAEDPWETLTNARDSLATLQELTLMPLAGELTLGRSSTSGLFLLLGCVRSALQYEIEKMPSSEL